MRVLVPIFSWALVSCTGDFLSGTDRAPDPAVAGSPTNAGSPTDAGSPADAGSPTDTASADVSVGACEEAGCPPTVLLSRAMSVQGIAVDSMNVYFADAIEGVIWKCALGGCNDEPVALSFTYPYPQAITVNNGNVYWLDYFVPFAGADPRIQGSLSMSRSEGYDNPPSTLAAPLAGAMSIAFDTTAFYWEDLGTEAGTGDIMKCVLGGSACTLTTLATSRTLLTSFGGGIAVDAKNVYWSDAEGIMKCSTAGGDPSPVPVVPGAQASWLVVHGTNVFWGDDTQGAIYECPLSGCPTSNAGVGIALSVQGRTPQGMVADDANVYWTDFGTGQVLRCAVGGCDGGPTVIADHQDQPCRMTMDDARIYWATCPDSAEGAIYTAPK